MRSGERAAGVCGPYGVDLGFWQGSAAPTRFASVFERIASKDTAYAVSLFVSE